MIPVSSIINRDFQIFQILELKLIKFEEFNRWQHRRVEIYFQINWQMDLGLLSVQFSKGDNLISNNVPYFFYASHRWKRTDMSENSNIKTFIFMLQFNQKVRVMYYTLYLQLVCIVLRIFRQRKKCFKLMGLPPINVKLRFMWVHHTHNLASKNSIMTWLKLIV